MSLPKNCPNEPGMYWAITKRNAKAGLKAPNLLIHIEGEAPFLKMTIYKPFWKEWVTGPEDIDRFLGPCDMPGDPE